MIQIVTKLLYGLALRMDPRSELDMTYAFPITHHQTQNPIHSLVPVTVHRAATAWEVTSLKHSWRAIIIFNQMKLKHFMKQLRKNCPQCEHAYAYFDIYRESNCRGEGTEAKQY